MKLKEISREVRIRVGVGFISQILIVCLVFSNLLLASVVLTKRDVTRTIIVPPMLHKSVWVENDNFSSEYLEEMGYFLAMLNFDIQPSTVDYNHDLFLKHVSPSAYGALKIKSDAVRGRIKDQQESYYFKTMSVTPDPANKRVAITGLKETTIGATKMGIDQVSYLISFEYTNGRVYVSKIEETTPEKPFEVKKVSEGEDSNG